MSENEINLFALIVLYNKNYKDSLVYQSIAARTDVSFIICDNSTEDYGNEALSDLANVTYINMEGNQGLSKAYNRGIQTLSEKNGILCLFDDDTKIPQNYFKKILAGFQKNPDKKVILPIVMSQGKIISPMLLNAWGMATLFQKKEDAMTNKDENFSAINSGMAIDLDVFREYRYDEQLFLDGIDHKFMADMKEKGIGYQVADTILFQKLSSFEKPPRNVALERFAIFISDTRIANDKKTANFLIWKRALSLTKKYKTFGFLRKIYE